MLSFETEILQDEHYRDRAAHGCRSTYCLAAALAASVLTVSLLVLVRWYVFSSENDAQSSLSEPAAQSLLSEPASDNSLSELGLFQSNFSELALYRKELDQFRSEFGGSRQLPNIYFFMFGMGSARKKTLYKNGCLIDIQSKIVLRQWEATADVILPHEYKVSIKLRDGNLVEILENESAVWIHLNMSWSAISGTESPLILPSFSGRRFSRVLRVLHHELLINVAKVGPVPNLFVYPKPWYRDSAMIAMALQRTGNLKTLEDWVVNLRDPYDYNNGNAEPDNLGQALYLISLVSNQSHPLVKQIIAEIPKFLETSTDGPFINGISDGAYHPVYQTKWLKFGLRALILNDSYVVPHTLDSYSALFWMDFKMDYVAGNDASDTNLYPYLGWACNHFHGSKQVPISANDYPLTWERHASKANYAGMDLVSHIFTEQQLSVPHTWHAAEVFLYALSLNSSILAE